MTLTPSVVAFDEATHTYTGPDAQQLSGITSLIHSVLRLGIYPKADAYARQVIIPTAGYYGSCLHRAIEAYETLGVMAPEFPAEDHETEDFGTITFPAQNVSEDLNNYIAIKQDNNWQTLAVEFTVSLGQFASQIDLILDNGDGTVTLVDHKTSNLNSFPGGVSAFLEYVSWQLSCYKLMFERQTDIRVTKLLCDWYHRGESKIFELAMQPDTAVEKLLTETVATLDPDTGKWSYSNHEMQAPDDNVTGVDIIPAADITALADVLRTIADIKRQADEAEQRAAELKARLLDTMLAAGIKTWDNDNFTATVRKPTTRKNFDSKRFQKEHPALYDEFLTETEVKPSITIKLK